VFNLARASTHTQRPDSWVLWSLNFDAGLLPSQRRLAKSLYRPVTTRSPRTPVAGSRVSVSPLLQTWAIMAWDQLEDTMLVARESLAGFSRPNRSSDTGVREPEFMPTSYVTEVRDPGNTWGKIVRNRLAGIEQFRDRWDQIAQFLANSSTT
jgi:hypothetical protein